MHSLSVLLAAADPSLTDAALGGLGPIAATLRVAACPDDALAALAETPARVLLVGPGLQGSALGEFLAAARSASPASLPFVVGRAPDARSVVAALRAGALDYLEPPWAPGELAATLLRADADASGDQPNCSVCPELGPLLACLCQRQRLDALGVLSPGVAHELNNPVNIIVNCAELLEDETPAGSELRVYASDIRGAAQRIARTLRDLFTFADGGPDEPAWLTVDDIAGPPLRLARKVLERDAVRVQTRWSPGLPSFPGQAVQLQQVILNLLLNARVALGARHAPGAATKVLRLEADCLEREGREVLDLRVWDNSGSLPGDGEHRVFEPFLSLDARRGHLGIGLAVSRAIVARHGGRLWFESEEGAFTCYHLELPLTAQQGGAGRAEQ